MLTDKPKETVRTTPTAYPNAESVRQELERIVESGAFKATPRRKKMICYLVDELLAGRGRELKGYSIATLVFGRDDSFDPQTDPVVRLEARRLRHDLDGYYASDGRTNPLRINIPKGQYAPVIEWVEAEADVISPAPTKADAVESIADVPAKTHTRNSPVFGRAAVAEFVSLVLFLGVIEYVRLQPATGTADSRAEQTGASIVVLPFTTNGDDPKKALLAGGMADEIMASINRFGGIRLYLPSGKEKGLSGDDPIAIGKSLNLSYVVNGSIDLDADSEMLRVTTRLIEVKTQRIVWIGSYDRDYSASSLRSVQQEIANSIASALGESHGVLQPRDRDRVVSARGL